LLLLLLLLLLLFRSLICDGVKSSKVLSDSNSIRYDFAWSGWISSTVAGHHRLFHFMLTLELTLKCWVDIFYLHFRFPVLV
jgi:hypothetical protein